MILSKLNDYYDRLADSRDPDTGKLKVPVFGYSDEKIGYILVLSVSGELVDVVNHQDTSGKKSIPKQIPVPRPEKRTSGVQPNFLWDKPAYVLGVQANSDKKTSVVHPWLQSLKTFEAFKKHHIEMLGNSSDEGLSALVKFLQQWNPENINIPPCNLDMFHANLAFQLDGDRCYLHERDAAKKLWANILETSNQSAEGNCLVLGRKSKIARLHPSIKGVYGGQSSGGSIVAFNAESYESYGKTQGDNAPVSEIAAFKYTTALNYLLNRDNNHCLTVGDASVVFWAIADDSSQAQKAEQLFLQTVNPTDDSETAQLKPVVEQISKGRALKEIAPDIDPNTRFYLLGLAPNASRLSIRYWLESSFGQLQTRIAEHFTDMSLDPLPWQNPPSIWRLLVQLAPNRQGQRVKSEEIPAHLAGELMRSILSGNRYPHSLLAQLVLRIRNDGHISSLRVALVKAVIHRDYRKQIVKEEIPMSLDEENINKAYLLGRLFAVLERIQSSAIEGANASISDRYYGTASAVPYSVFPRLLAGSKNHLSKIRKKMRGHAVNLEKDVTTIIGKLPAEFPKHFSIEEQGRFVIGYYHQREKYYLSTGYPSDEATTETD